MKDNDTPSNIQKAVDFFRQANLSHLLEKLRERYIELGRVGGQIILENTAPGERRNIASFLGKPPYREIDIKVRLIDVDKALRQSGFACELPDLLAAFFPGKPLVTRPQQRAGRAIHQADFRIALTSIAMELPADARSRHWLLHGQHGQDWLFSHYKNEPIEEQEYQLNLVRYVLRALDQLPASRSPHSLERLALFAQHISGDPHFFDSDRASGRLFRHALVDLVGLWDGASQGDSAQAPDLYANAGLLIDTISSNVAVFNLAGAFYPDGTADPMPQAAGARVLLLPLRQVIEWQSALPTRPDLYVFENPQVFEEVVAGLTDSNSDKPVPTLVCTAGWPSTAALTLLDLLLAQSSITRLHYSGDFDLAGLKIATFLLERYPGRLTPWHFDPESYVKAMHDEGVPAKAADLTALSSLPKAFAPLVAIMQEKGKWAYQEGIAQLLTEDVKG